MKPSRKARKKAAIRKNNWENKVVRQFILHSRLPKGWAIAFRTPRQAPRWGWFCFRHEDE